MSLRVCRIKNPRTGEFSRGGSCADRLWGKRGKAWSDIGHMKSHLRIFGDDCVTRHYADKTRYYHPRAHWPYRGCVVEIADFDAGTTTQIPMRDILATMTAVADKPKSDGKTLLEALVERFGDDEI